MAKYFASEARGRKQPGGDAHLRAVIPIRRNMTSNAITGDSLLMCIGEGTNEMQRMIIAKQHLRENPA